MLHGHATDNISDFNRDAFDVPEGVGGWQSCGRCIEAEARKSHAVTPNTLSSHTHANQNAVGALDAIEPLAGAAKLAATDSGFAAQVNRGLRDQFDNRPQFRAPAAHGRGLMPSGRRAKLARQSRPFRLNE
jgi:hypothetical protein